MLTKNAGNKTKVYINSIDKWQMKTKNVKLNIRKSCPDRSQNKSNKQ